MMKSNLKPRKQPLDAEYQLMEINWEDFSELDLLASNLNPSPVSPKSNQLKFFQLNQRRSEIVDQLTKNYVISHNLNYPNKPMICLLQEPFYYKQGNFYSPDTSYAPPIYLHNPGTRARAAICCPKIYNPKPVHQLMSRDSAAAVITVNKESFLIVSIYNPPNTDPSALLSFLEGNLNSLHLSKAIIGGDLNCRSILWSNEDSPFGEIFEGFTLSNDLQCINPSNHEPTFCGPMGKSRIDATFISSSLTDRVNSWQLHPINIFEGLDHRPISFQLSLDDPPMPNPPGFDFRKIDKSAY